LQDRIVRSPPPPLRVALVAVVAAAAIMAMLAWSACRERRLMQQANWAHDTARLAKLKAEAATNQPGPLRLVGIGTSLLGAATYYDDRMVLTAGQAGVSLRYVQLARAGTFEDWGPLVAQVCKAHPDIVVIEDRLLFWPEPGCDLTMIRQHSQDMLERILHGHDPRRKAAQEAVRARMFERGLRMKFKKLTLAELQQARAARAVRFGGGLRPGGREALEAFRAGGIRVIILPMPVSRLVEADPDVVLQHKRLDAELARLAADGLVARLDCPLAFESNEFRDLRHMMPQGQDRYSRWLIGELARMPRP
jgi:hypothetical protein